MFKFRERKDGGTGIRTETVEGLSVIDEASRQIFYLDLGGV
jgi:hypothetical protein